MNTNSAPDSAESQAPVDEEVPSTRLAAVRRRVMDAARAVARLFAWLRHPEAVGQPLVLSPRGVRLLVLLVVGNLVMVGLLTVGLYRATMHPLVVTSPLVIPMPVTATSHPGDEAALSLPTPTPLGSGGSIAFTLRRNGNADIYVLDQANRQLVRLTHDPAEDRQPTWSPDGNYIAFASNRAANWDIYLLDLLSGALIRLTRDQAFDSNPAWSPDGRWIAFESYRRGNLDIFVMSTSGEEIRRITTDPAPNYGPVWSSDGQAIAYTTFRDGNKDIFVQPLEGPRSAVNITQSPDLDEYDPAWSPDGRYLVYVSGPIGNPSLQTTTFDWETMSADQTQTDLFGAGTSPTWAPDGRSFIFTYRRGGQSHIVAANIQGWGLFQEVYGLDEPLSDLAWTAIPLSSRAMAWARSVSPDETSLYIELLQPTATAGPPYRLVSVPNIAIREVAVEGQTQSPGAGPPLATSAEPSEPTLTPTITPTPTPTPTPLPAMLSDRVNESFNALRQRVIAETGRDYLANLSHTYLPMDHTPPAGQSRMSWHVCGRAISLDSTLYTSTDSPVELVREDVGNVTYWRVFLRTESQDGSMGEPLREAPWDLYAREAGGRALVEGGCLSEDIPSGYYVDFTTLASDYGWERVPSLWRWRYFWPDVRWEVFQKTDGMTWWECMLELFSPEEIEEYFGPLPPEYGDGD